MSTTTTSAVKVQIDALLALMQEWGKLADTDGTTAADMAWAIINQGIEEGDGDEAYLIDWLEHKQKVALGLIERMQENKAQQAKWEAEQAAIAKARAFQGSPKQRAFIDRLLGEKETTPKMAAWWAQVQEGETTCTKRQASQFIDTLLALPAKQGAGNPATLEPGYYADGDQVFVVVLSKAGRPYAKVWDVREGSERASWVYAPGAAKTIAAKGLEAMTLEQAKEWGHLHGRCIRCGRALSDPKSVEAGIGPVCANYWG